MAASFPSTRFEVLDLRAGYTLHGRFDQRLPPRFEPRQLSFASKKTSAVLAAQSVDLTREESRSCPEVAWAEWSPWWTPPSSPLGTCGLSMAS
jgi:hypothetical protein